MMWPIFFIIGIVIGIFYRLKVNNVKHQNGFDFFEKASTLMFIILFGALIVYASLNLVYPEYQAFIKENLITNSITLILGFFTFRLGIEAKKDREERVFSEVTRLHSVKLNDLSLIFWPEYIDSILVKGYEYSHDKEEIMPNSLGEFNIVPHCDFLKSHMESGYPLVWSKWCNLVEETQRYNELLSNFAEELRKIINDKSDELNHEPYYHKLNRTPPLEYYLPLIIIEKMLFELDYRLKWIEGEWRDVNLNLDEIARGDHLYHRVVMGGTVVSANREYDDAVKIQNFIINLLKEEEVIKKAREIKVLNDKIDQLIKDFTSDIMNINSRIELGENIKGICEVCPK